MSRRSYRVEIRWTHRKLGPSRTVQKAEGTSIRRAINNALVSFFSDAADRKTRRDAHTDVQLHARRLPTKADQ